MKIEQRLAQLTTSPKYTGPDPAQFQAGVWHEIAHRRALADTGSLSFADTLGGFFGGLTISGAALAVAIGLSVGMLNEQPARQNQTATALKLGVFHPESKELPHTYLMVRQ